MIPTPLLIFLLTLCVLCMFFPEIVKFFRPKSKEEKTLEECGCVTFCPHCNGILNNEGATWTQDETGLEIAVCSACGTKTTWEFGAPVPLLLKTETPDELPHP